MLVRVWGLRHPLFVRQNANTQTPTYWYNRHFGVKATPVALAGKTYVIFTACNQDLARSTAIGAWGLNAQAAAGAAGARSLVHSGVKGLLTYLQVCCLLTTDAERVFE